MSILPQLERDLLDAAQRHRSTTSNVTQSEHSERTRSPAKLAAHARRLRAPLIAFCALLAMAAIALAAGVVIPTGAPVRPSNQRNPDVGIGVPVSGKSVLLPLNAPDPEGGLPWGMRIVHTTRGEVCIQVGRIENGQLGELGVDGAFHDDGRFHPLPPSALPSLTRIGMQPPGDANTSCNIEGHAVAGRIVGIDRSASELPHKRNIPISDRRDVYYGLLGPQAVDVTYRAEHGHEQHTEPVVPESGAYLIVRRTTPREQVGSADWGIGTYGDLAPSGAITAFGYRSGGTVCERGHAQPPRSTVRLPDACPEPHWPRAVRRPQNMHRPVHVRLLIRSGVITGADVTFIAPFAIDSASHGYAIAVPTCDANGITGGLEALQRPERNVARGAPIHIHLSDPFSGRPCGHRSITVEALYNGADGEGRVIVGTVTVHEPPGTRPAPVPTSAAPFRSRHGRLRAR